MTAAVLCVYVVLNCRSHQTVLPRGSKSMRRLGVPMSKRRSVYGRLEPTAVRLFGNTVHRSDVWSRVGNPGVQRLAAHGHLDRWHSGYPNTNRRAGDTVQNFPPGRPPTADQCRVELIRSTRNRTGSGPRTGKRQTR